MPSARQSFVVHATPTELRSVIVEFGRYPEFLPAMEEATVLRSLPDSPSEWTVAFSLNLIRRVAYTLRLWEDARTTSDGSIVIRWSLVEGALFKANEGSWTLTPMLAPDGAIWTTAAYQIDVELDVFLPRPLLSSLTGSNLPLALAAFKDRAERRIARVGL
jgi:ribosome-associated toxin RatA of RatAB toxin-antitoxin module